MLERVWPSQAETVLDVGCNAGDTLAWAHGRGTLRLLGIDINPAAVALAQKKLASIPGADVRHASADAMPFEDACADVVTCLEVIEHVPASLRPAVFCELRRVLRPGGRLILTAPHRGVFAWLDPENVRFRLPRLHARASKWAGGSGKEAGYKDQQHGVVWHEHFRIPELQKMLPDELHVECVFGRACLLFPLGAWFRWPFYRRGLRGHWACRLAERAMALDAETPYPMALAYNLVLVARRSAAI